MSASAPSGDPLFSWEKGAAAPSPLPKARLHADLGFASNADETKRLDLEDVTPEQASDYLGEALTQLKLTGTLPATHVCKLAYWASRGGCGGLTRALAYQPYAQAGKYSEHFDHAIGRPEDEDQYWLPLAQADRVSGNRLLVDLATKPLHEALYDELQTSMDAADRLHERLLAGALPPVYTSHPVVLSAPPGVDVHPVAVYMDGIQFSRYESAVGCFGYFVCTGRRHLLAVLRKTELCSCGCGGWCSVYPIMLFLNWGRRAGAKGKFPGRRHDKSVFGEGDEVRASMAGRDLGGRICIISSTGTWRSSPILLVFRLGQIIYLLVSGAGLRTRSCHTFLGLVR